MNIFSQIDSNLKQMEKNTNEFINKIINPASKAEAETEVEQEINVEELNKPNLLEKDPLEHKIYDFEKNLDNKFIGCFVDDPTNPSLTGYLGEVNDQEQCILRGKESNYQYVGIQQGNKCFGTNILPDNSKMVERNKCNVKCNDNSKGHCGGFYYNQIYSTTQDKKMYEPSNIIEKYKNINIELFGINDQLSQEHFVQENPINPYILILWLIIIIITILLIIEYINKKV